MPDAVVYSRVSTTIQREEGTSLDSQVRACRALARSKGFQVVSVITEDWPGDTLERPELEKLRLQVARKEISAVFIYDPDRLARHPILQAMIEMELEKFQVQLHYVTEPPADSPEAQLIRYIKGYSSQLERVQIRERTMRGRKERVLRGKLATGSNGMYGYDYDKATGKRIVNEKEAEVVRLIFHLLLDEGISLGSICARLVSLGISSPKGSDEWGRSTVSRILRQEAYTGVTYGLRYTKVESAKPSIQLKRYKKTHLVLRDRSEWVEMPDDVTPPIIPRDVFEQAQIKLAQNQQYATRNAKRQYLLTGRVKCGLCGRAYGVDYHKATGNHYYRCSGHKKMIPSNRCYNRSPNGKVLEDAIWQKISDALQDPDIIMREVEKRREGMDKTALVKLLETIDSRLQEIKKQQSKLARLYLMDDMDEETLKGLTADLKSDQRALETERDKLLQKIDEADELMHSRESIENYCRKMSHNIDRFSFEDKKLALQTLEITIVVYPDHVAVNGFLPNQFVFQPS